MTLYEIIGTIETAAMTNPAINAIASNNIFAINAIPDVRYGVFGWTQGQHVLSADRNLMTYAFTLFYVDRLTENASNREIIQSVGISVLSDICRAIGARGAIRFTTFNQRFADECAGVMCNIEVVGTADTLCVDMPYQVLIDRNGWYFVTADNEKILVRNQN